MISYKDFITLMEGKGYIFNNDNPIMIDNSNSIIKTFHVDEGNIGKILELQCPDNIIMSTCGENHPGGCERNYLCNIKCFNDNGKEPFQEIHQCIMLTHTRHTIVDIIVTKILQNEINKYDTNIQQLLTYSDTILKFIQSKDPNEYLIWIGNYKTFNKEFLNESINLYSNEKLIFYITKPDLDIAKVKFEMKVDIFELKKPEELIILDKDKIIDLTCSDYKTVVNAEAL